MVDHTFVFIVAAVGDVEGDFLVVESGFVEERVSEDAVSWMLLRFLVGLF